MLKYLENGQRYDVDLNGGPIGKHLSIAYRLTPSDLTLDDLEASKVIAGGLLPHDVTYSLLLICCL